MVNTRAAVQEYTSSFNYKLCVDTHGDSKMSRHAARMQFPGTEHKTGKYSTELWSEANQRQDVGKYDLMMWVSCAGGVI